MDTIEINANEILNEDAQDKKKIIGDAAKTATLAGAAGIAVGAVTMEFVDSHNITSDDISDEDTTHTNTEYIENEIPEQENIAVVNPEEVMLEEQTEEMEVVVDNPSQDSHPEPYQPFANNDPIQEIETPSVAVQPEDVLIADNMHSTEQVISDDPTVNLICGLPETTQENEILDEPIATDDELLASNNDFNTDVTDIQSDLMA